MESLHVLVEPVPVATTVSVSEKKVGLVVPSFAETLAVQMKLVSAAVLTVMVMATVTVPPTTVAGGRRHLLPLPELQVEMLPCGGRGNPECPSWPVEGGEGGGKARSARLRPVHSAERTRPHTWGQKMDRERTLVNG
jgi:hypothetical protein